MKRLIRPHTASLLITACIVFLALLLSTPKLNNTLTKGPEQIARIKMMELKGALQLFSFDMGRYPTTAEGLEALVRNPGDLKSWGGPYLSRAEVPRDPWGNAYVYRCPGQYGVYDLISYGRDGVEGGIGEDADIVNWGDRSASR